MIYHGHGVHGSFGDSDRLERLQKCCIRFIGGIERHEYITSHRLLLESMRLYDRRTLHVACMINKIINGLQPPYLENIFTKKTIKTQGHKIN